MRASRLCALALVPLVVISDAALPASATSTRVLVFSRTTGFRHASIEPAVAAIERLGEQHHLEVDASEDPAVFTPEKLRDYAAVVFVSTTGNPISDPAQHQALRQYIERGGGFVGVHAASDQDADSRASWPWFGVLLGAYFGGHPLYRTRPSGDESCAVGEVVSCHTGVVTIEDPRHPSTRGGRRTWGVYDEFYGFLTNPRPEVHVLATIDEHSYLDDPNRLEFGPGAMGEDHPIAWCHRVGRGRSFYTALGHDAPLFSDRRYLSHLLGGILWAAGRAAGSCAAPRGPSRDRGA
ncbi:MAG TPA: ThuA domain-containing protein [Acidimicrobiia bacterium]